MTRNNKLSIRELRTEDLEQFANYWSDSDDLYLTSMGVDVEKLPSEEDFFKYWKSQVLLPIKEKLSYCVVWQKEGKLIGHSSTRPTAFGKEAYMHLHLWHAENRSKGIGFELMKLTVPHYFEKLQLQDLYCEPYALNAAPNKLLEKAGFDFVKEYISTPGPFNFEQPVKLWHLSYQKFQELYQTNA